MSATEVDLSPVQDENVFIALVEVLGNARPRRVLQESRRRTAIALAVETMDVHAGAIGRPLEVRAENSTREL